MVGPGFGIEWSATRRRGSPRELRSWLEIAQAACDDADRMALSAFRKAMSISTKADGSFVTEVDQAIEQRIRDRLADAVPDHGTVGEEFGSESDDASVRWYIDPIDGTHSFIRGVPVFATLLAAARDGEVQVGVVSAPALGARWFALRGDGAWGRGAIPWLGEEPRRLTVSDVGSITVGQVLYRAIRDMRASRVAAGFDRLVAASWRERGYGDFLGYTLVAGGSAEVMIEGDLGPWDLAATTILVEEAGGRVTDFDGRRCFDEAGRSTTGEALASNGLVHDDVLARLWRA